MANRRPKKPSKLAGGIEGANITGKRRSFNKVGPSKDQSGFFQKPWEGSGRPGRKPTIRGSAELADVRLTELRAKDEPLNVSGTLGAGFQKTKGAPGSTEVRGGVVADIPTGDYLKKFGIDVDALLQAGGPTSVNIHGMFQGVFGSDTEVTRIQPRWKVSAGVSDVTGKPDPGIRAEVNIPLGK